MAARAQTADGCFVGREDERAELRAALAAALAGSTRLVLVGGEPGIGKTRLAEMLAADAAADGVPVWWGRGWEDGTAPAFWPWNTALTRWVDRVGAAALLAEGERIAPELCHVFPVLRERVPGLRVPPIWESDQARFRLFDVVSRFLASQARRAGLVIVLDDLHWADVPSLKLLEFVVADLRYARLLVVATFRDTDVDEREPFTQSLARLTREASARQLALSGFTPDECARFIAATVADDEALGLDVHRETSGNPFVLGEILRLRRLRHDGATWLVPPGVREVVSARLDRLGADARHVLSIAALLGNAFGLDRLEAVLGPAEEPSPWGAALDRAVRARILTDVEGTPGEYAFAHALIRRVLVDALEPSERAAWHARIASAIERLAGARAEAVAGELVRHFTAAGTLDGLARAHHHACRGAERAARELGWEEAARLYEIALDTGARCGALDDVRAGELRLARALALRRSGDVAGARAACQDVARTCRGGDRPDLLARSALIHAGPVPEFGLVEPTVRALLEDASRGADALDDSLRARLHARLGADIVAANDMAHVARALALSDDAARAARRAGDSGALAHALMVSLYAAALGMGGPPASVPSPQEILEAAERGGVLEVVMQIRHTRAAFMFAVGEADGFWAEIDALATLAASSRVPEALWLADALAAMRATVEGRFAEGRHLLDRALATGVRMQLANAVPVHVSQQIMWHAMTGRLAELLPALDEFIMRHPAGTAWQPVRALARLESGDEVGARAELASLVANGIAAAEAGVHCRSYGAGLAALAAALGDGAVAGTLYDLVSRRGEVWAVDGCTTLGPWALTLGLLARCCDRPADAAAHFEEAIRVGHRMRSRPIVARAQGLLVETWLASGPDARAADVLAEAERTARELGLADVRARVEHLRARATARPTRPANVFRREGAFWTVRFADTVIRLKDGKGVRYLAALLAVPGQEVHVLQLASGGDAPTATAGVLSRMALDDDADVRARREYRARLDEVRSELDEAERFDDIGRAERLRAEHDQLVAAIAGRFRGRTRVRGPAETARKAVTKALRTQIGRLLEEHPTLGHHLRASVRLGTVCVYRPATPVPWEL